MVTLVPTGKRDTSPWPTRITGLDVSIKTIGEVHVHGTGVPGGQHVGIPQTRNPLQASRLRIYACTSQRVGPFSFNLV